MLARERSIDSIGLSGHCKAWQCVMISQLLRSGDLYDECQQWRVDGSEAFFASGMEMTTPELMSLPRLVVDDPIS